MTPGLPTLLILEPDEGRAARWLALAHHAILGATLDHLRRAHERQAPVQHALWILCTDVDAHADAHADPGQLDWPGPRVALTHARPLRHDQGAWMSVDATLEPDQIMEEIWLAWPRGLAPTQTEGT